MDWVKHVHPNDQLVKFNPNKGKDKLFIDPPMEEDLDLPVQHYSPEADFCAYIESGSESEDESAAEEQAGEPAEEAQQALLSLTCLTGVWQEELRETWEFLFQTFSYPTGVGHPVPTESSKCSKWILNFFLLEVAALVYAAVRSQSFIKLGSFHQHIS